MELITIAGTVTLFYTLLYFIDKNLKVNFLFLIHFHSTIFSQTYYYFTGKKFNQVCKLPAEIPSSDWFHECQGVHHTLQPGFEQASCALWELLPDLVLLGCHSHHHLHTTCPHTFNQHSLNKRPELEAGYPRRCCPAASAARSEPAKIWDALLLHNSFNLYSDGIRSEC